MDWTAQIDAYCERIDPGLWSEPVNALTNLAFILAALLMAVRLRGSGLPLAWSLVWALALIGVTSGLWHIFAVAWTGAADSLSILVFILIYLFASNRDFWGLSTPWAIAGVLAFFPFAAIAAWGIAQVPFFQISGVYWAVAALIGGTAFALRHRAAVTARNLGIGAAILCLSITLRSLDESLCEAIPLGTHFLWHTLNAVMLAWMIETYRRHMTSAA